MLLNWSHASLNNLSIVKLYVYNNINKYTNIFIPNQVNVFFSREHAAQTAVGLRQCHIRSRAQQEKKINVD